MITCMKYWVMRLGPMRIGLFVLAVVLVLLVPEPGTPAEYYGSGLFFSVLVPVLAPLLLAVLLLDALMSRVWLGDAQGDEARRYRTLLRLDLGFSLLLVLFWLPYFLALR